MLQKTFCLFACMTTAIGANWCSVGGGQWKGKINDKYITEASGLAYSRKTRGILWVNNDSDQGIWIHAISENGQRRTGVELQGTTCKDWEDIAINSENGKSYIYLGDIGDNRKERRSLTIYKFEEPHVSPYFWNGNKHISYGSIEHIHVYYPSNKRYDCEAMVVDPLNRDILLFTKDNGNAISHVYKVPHGYGSPKKLQYVTTLPYRSVTGADISPDGSTLALTSYGEGWSWRKTSYISWADFLKSKPTPCKLNLYRENAREAIAVTNSGYWTTSEWQNQPLWFYPKY